MKKVLFCLSMVAMLMTACSKDEEENNNSALPPLPNPNDVCSAMDDVAFMKLCYEKFDINKDGAVSRAEADAVKEMDISAVGDNGFKSMKGICYFTNVESLDCTYQHNLKEADLSYNTKLKSITFKSCYDLENIVLPENLQIIGEGCFDGNNLFTITLPKNIKTIEAQAFYMCDNLTTVYCKAPVPPTYNCGSWHENDDWDLQNNEWLALFSNASISKIYVPKAAVSAYKQAKVWRKYASKIEGYNF